MPFFTTSQEWLEQSSLLLQARPTTTRITTKYTLSKPKAGQSKRKSKKPTSTTEAAAADEPTTSPPPPSTEPAAQESTSTTTPSAAAESAQRATLVLKTYDPVSGVCLKYRTQRAQEVGRLIASLGRLGRHMAAMPPLAEGLEGVGQQAVAAQDVSMGNGAEGGEGVVADGAAAATQQPAQGGGGAGGGKKKKKGKK